MPANLTPQYQKAEDEFRRAQTPSDRVEGLQKMLALIPKHKGTEKLQAELKSRLKEAKEELQTEKKTGKKKGPSYKYPRQGAGQIVLLGAPNSGKSRILKELTNAEPVVAEYPFATHEPLPGMMPWHDVTVQLIDTPPITGTHFEPYLINIVRSADAAALCFDGSSDDSPDETAEVVRQLEQRKTLLSDRSGFEEEDFSIVHLKTLLVVTRGDDPDFQTRLELFREQVPRPFPVVLVELDRESSREELRNRFYEFLDVIRVYTKKPGKPADYKDPFTLHRGATVEDLALLVHREMAEKLKNAKAWGEGVHDGQNVGREHALSDRDLIELHW